jgi:hypothetical protein
MSHYEINVKCITTARKRFVADLRVLEVLYNGYVLYILVDFDDNETYVFNNMSELLEFVRREKTDVESYVAECP